MSLIYITGPTGSGKSTICEEFRKRSFLVYDTDRDGIRHWINEATGEPIQAFQKGQQHTKEWLNDNKLGLSKNWLLSKKKESVSKHIFICGTSPIDYVNEGIYDKIFVLVIDEQTLIDRVKNRTNNNYGKETTQLEKAIKWRKPTIDRYIKAGAYEIDATKSPELMTEEILKMI